MQDLGTGSVSLQAGATVAIVGGGPAGSFAAIHLLRQARSRDIDLQVVIFEARRGAGHTDCGIGGQTYSGCPQCAGGISPGLNEALQGLGLPLPPAVIQSRIASIVVQGNWKHIVLPVPDNRPMFSVYRGILPFGQHGQEQCFDVMLLDHATDLGARLVTSRVDRAYYDGAGKPVLCYQVDGAPAHLSADLAIFAGGVNEKTDAGKGTCSAADLFRMLQPGYQPPAVRRALIFELEAAGTSGEDAGDLHFIESSVGQLQLDMCSIIPKRGYFTVTLIGKSVDSATNHTQINQLIRDFLDLPQIRRTLTPAARLRVRCICNPVIVVGMAVLPYSQRAVAVGDMVTSRQYKDGILSAHNMARDLAAVLFERGVDAHSLEKGYGATLARFRRDNRYASLIFKLYRGFFTNSFLSRVIYLTYSSELKSRHEPNRRFAGIFWAITSGDQSYEEIARSMLAPATLWQIFTGGVLVTLRNWLGELLFGLDWHGLGRFPTAIPLENLEAKRDQVLAGRRYEFECIYTIHLRVEPAAARSLLARFGERDRPYLNPRWVSIRRTAGEPLQPQSRITYRVFGGLVSFAIDQNPDENPDLIVYTVHGGFADGGTFLFEIAPGAPGQSYLTVYLAFDYARGASPGARLYWRLFRLLFPEFIHDVLWNHALCEFKQAVESVDLDTEPQLINLKQL